MRIVSTYDTKDQREKEDKKQQIIRQLVLKMVIPDKKKKK